MRSGDQVCRYSTRIATRWEQVQFRHTASRRKHIGRWNQAYREELPQARVLLRPPRISETSPERCRSRSIYAPYASSYQPYTYPHRYAYPPPHLAPSASRHLAAQRAELLELCIPERSNVVNLPENSPLLPLITTMSPQMKRCTTGVRAASVRRSGIGTMR